MRKVSRKGFPFALAFSFPQSTAPRKQAQPLPVAPAPTARSDTGECTLSVCLLAQEGRNLQIVHTTGRQRIHARRR